MSDVPLDEKRFVVCLRWTYTENDVFVEGKLTVAYKNGSKPWKIGTVRSFCPIGALETAFDNGYNLEQFKGKWLIICEFSKNDVSNEDVRVIEAVVKEWIYEETRMAQEIADYIDDAVPLDIEHQEVEIPFCEKTPFRKSFVQKDSCLDEYYEKYKDVNRKIISSVLTKSEEHSPC